MINNKNKVDEYIGAFPATGGIVITGRYSELCMFLERIEQDKPDSIKIVYKRFSPGRLYLRAEGEK